MNSREKGVNAKQVTAPFCALLEGIGRQPLRPTNLIKSWRNMTPWFTCQVVEVIKEEAQIVLHHPGDGPPRSFCFDGVFGTDSQQCDVFQEVAFSLISSVIEG